MSRLLFRPASAIALLIVFSGAVGAQNSPASQPPAPVDALLELDRPAVAARRDEVSAALAMLQKRFDESIRSDRTVPEQRKVQYDATALDSGLRLARAYADATGEKRPLELFVARRKRIEGTVLLNQRKWGTAIERLRDALADAERLGDVWLQIITRTNLAYGEIERGNEAGALEQTERANALAERLDLRSHALTMLNLTSMYGHMGNFEGAAVRGVKAVEFARQLGNRLWEGNALLDLGVAYQQLGRNDQARATFIQARDVLLKTQDRLGIGRSYYNLALVEADFGDYTSAAADMERALPIIREVDIRHSHEIDERPSGERPDNPMEADALALLVRWFGNLGEAQKVRQYGSELESARARSHSDTGHVHKKG